MNAIKHKILLAAICIVSSSILLLSSCEGNDSPAPNPNVPEGYTELNVDMPGVLNHLSVGKTRNTNLVNLPVGTTVWVLIQKYDLGTTTAVEQEKPYAYRVRSAESGSRNLERLTTVETDNGTTIVYTTAATEGSPVVVEKGYTYRFRLIAPAYELVYTKATSKFKVSLDNGQWLAANDERYNNNQGSTVNTTAKKIDIDVDASERLDVQLNPMIQQTARLHFSIHPLPDKGVHTAELLTAGFVVGGLELGPKDWGPDMEDNFTLVIGPKRGNTILRDYELKDRQTASGVPYKSLELIIDVIPMNGRGNSLSVELNARINGVPVQLMTLIKDVILEHGNAYTGDFNLTIDGGITILNFTTVGWGTDVYPD